jgi:hypothetical protein
VATVVVFVFVVVIAGISAFGAGILEILLDNLFAGPPGQADGEADVATSQRLLRAGSQSAGQHVFDTQTREPVRHPFATQARALQVARLSKVTMLDVNFAEHDTVASAEVSTELVVKHGYGDAHLFISLVQRPIVEGAGSTASAYSSAPLRIGRNTGRSATTALIGGSWRQDGWIAHARVAAVW